MRPIRFQRLLFRFLVVTLLVAAAVTPALAQESTHVIQPGETLFRIALRYGVDINSLAAANNIVNTWHIEAGQTLVIPTAGTLDSSVLEQPAVNPGGAPVYHTISRGENLAAIARAYGLTPAQLAQMNSITNPNLIYAGQQLLVSGTPPAADAAPVEAAPPAPEVPAAPTSQATYTVQRGEHLSSIAARFGVSWLEIAQVNNISNADHVEAGQTLIIPAPGSVPAAAANPDLGILTGPAAPPAHVAVGRSIIVDLSDSRVYAYENGTLVRNVLVSTGLPATPTVTGNFAIYVKYRSQTMSGPGYYLPDVPYVMYFYQGYGLHGTYWHNNFGTPRSHGCVNLPTPEAEWFYHWADIGTPVHVQY